MITRRTLLTGAACAAWTSQLVTRAEANEVSRAAESVMTDNGDPQGVQAYLRSNPVGFDRLWVRRTTGEEMISVYRDMRFGLSPVPAQCLELSYFWRDVHDRDASVAITIELFDVLSRVQTSLSQLAGQPVPIFLNSGYRTPEHNARLEGAAVASEHLKARAGDIVIPGFEPAIIANAANMMKAGGIGVYKNFTHIDVGPMGRRWKG